MDAFKKLDSAIRNVATVLTVYGIETYRWYSSTNPLMFVATVLTVYGIETHD